MLVSKITVFLQELLNIILNIKGLKSVIRNVMLILLSLIFSLELSWRDDKYTNPCYMVKAREYKKRK